MSNDMMKRLENLRNRNKDENDPIYRIVETDKSVSKRWFHKIRSSSVDGKVIEAATDYYKESLNFGRNHVVPRGNLEDLILELPGVMFYYQAILVDCQQSRRWLEDHLERLEAKKYNFYMYDEEIKSKYGALKTTDASRFAKSDPEVAGIADYVRLLAYYEHHLSNLLATFENLKFTLNNIVTIRKEKLSEVWVDPTKESGNE